MTPREAQSADMTALATVAGKYSDGLTLTFDGQSAPKKAYVLKYLADKGIQFDSETIDNLIEASVLKLHHELYGGGSNAGD